MRNTACLPNSAGVPAFCPTPDLDKYRGTENAVVSSSTSDGLEVTAKLINAQKWGLGQLDNIQESAIRVGFWHSDSIAKLSAEMPCLCERIRFSRTVHQISLRFRSRP